MRHFYSFLVLFVIVSVNSLPSQAEPRDYAIDPTKLFVEEKIAHLQKRHENQVAWANDYASRKDQRNTTLENYASAQHDHLGQTIQTRQTWADDYASRKDQRQATIDEMNERQHFILTRWTETHRKYMGESN